jgi:heterodisulfide reductase subunit A
MTEKKEEKKDKDKDKVGVYICHCGGNISDVVDVQAVKDILAKADNVEIAKTHMFMCSAEGQKLIEDDIKEGKVNKIVVASCSPSLHQTTFRNVCDRAGLNQFLYEHANIREQVSWVHSHNKEEATEKSIKLVKSAVYKVSDLDPLESIKVSNTKHAVVIGGGVSGLRAALEIADNDISVDLLEKTPFLGGNMASLDKIFPTGEDAKELLNKLITKVMEHPLISVHLNSKILNLDGYIGNYKIKFTEIIPRGVNADIPLEYLKKAIDICPVTIENETQNNSVKPKKAIQEPARGHIPHSPAIDWNYCLGSKCGKCKSVLSDPSLISLEDPFEQEVEITAGSIITATGFKPYTPYDDEYGYNTYTNVITHFDLIKLMTEGGELSNKFEWNGKPIKNIGFIHCVGSRQADGVHETPDGHLNEYCSRVCCNATLQLANDIKEKFPAVNIYDFYQDIRTYSRFTEKNIYEEASKNGVVFLKYLPEELPVVEKGNNGRVEVKIKDQLTFGEEISVPLDLLVLSVGMTPQLTKQDIIIQDLKLPVGNDDFLLEVHPKLRPVEMSVDGIMIAGTAQSPMDITEASASATAAASKAINILGKDTIELDPFIAKVNEDVCNTEKCNQECVSQCEYANAIYIEDNKAKVNPALCKGCGACVSVCPVDGAIDIQGYPIKAIEDMVDAIVQEVQK